MALVTFKLFIAILSVLLLPVSGNAQKTLLSEGTPCDEAVNPCDTDKFLICTDGSCQCKEDQAVYIDEEETCQLLSNVPCEIEIGKQECAPYSECLPVDESAEDSWCTCEKSFVPNNNKRCYLPYTEICETNQNACDPLGFLNCGESGRCECSENSWFEPTEKTCVLYHGGVCNSDSGQSCTPNAVCTVNGCECSKPYIGNSEGKCILPVLEYDEACEQGIGNDFCNVDKFLECSSEKKCDCKNKLITWYNPTSETCNLLADQECSTANEAQSCVPNSACKIETPGSGSPPKCKCNEPLEVNSVGQCVISFEESCTVENDLCDRNGYLQCNDASKLCDCDRVNSVYEKDRKACTLLVSSQCSSLPTAQQCVVNGFCPAGFCVCRPPYIESPEGTCVLPILSYGQDCSTEMDFCDASKFLKCSSSNICRCENEGISQWYNSVDQTCNILATEICSRVVTPPSPQCIPYSSCQLDANNITRCTCEGNLEANNAKRCVISHGDTCNIVPDLCDPEGFLQCGSTGKCECQNKEDTAYNAVQKVCFILSGGQCFDVAGAQECVENAACTQGQCACNAELTPNPARRCMLSHGSTCNRTNDLCDKENFQECALIGSCQCVNDREASYDAITGMCTLLSNAICVPEAGYQMCGHNSICDLDRRRCTCSEGFEANVNRRCFIGYSNQCSVTNDWCNPAGFLECGENGRCLCQFEDDTWYDEGSKGCLLLAESPCSIQIGSQKCIHRSRCNAVSGSAPYRCTCDGTLQPNSNRKCFLLNEAICDEISDYCDPEGFLTCGSDNRCHCNAEDMRYEPNLKKCQILPNGTCSLVGSDIPECISNAQCASNYTCICNSGYEHSSKDLCQLAYESECTLVDDQCNKDNHLQCLGGKCSCPAGSIPDTDTSLPAKVVCMAGYRQPCNQGMSCNPKAHLQCTGGVCDCLAPGEQEFDNDVLKCLSLVNSRCSLNPQEDDIYLECGENAFCSEVEGDRFHGRCFCLYGYKPSWGSKCESGVMKLFPLTILSYSAIFTVIWLLIK